MEEINNNLNTKIEEQGEEIIKNNTQIKKQKDIINDLNKKINDLKDNNNELNNEIENLNNKITKLNNNIDEKNNLINKYFINIKEEQNKNSILEEKSKELKEKISKLQGDLDKIKLKNNYTENNVAYHTINETSDKKKDIILSQKESFQRRFKRLHTNSTKNTDLRNNNYELNNYSNHNSNTINVITSNNFKYNCNNTQQDENTANVNINKDEIVDFNPENYIIINSFKLTQNFKWILFKKNKNKNSIPTKRFSSNLISRRNSRHRNRNKSNDPKKTLGDISNEELNINTNNNINYENDSFSDFIWKPQKNRKEFLEFDSIINNNDSIDKDKKIQELEKNIKNLEDKLDKKEKDFNRVNMTYAKLFNRNKNPENNIDKLLDEIDKLKKENKKLKSEHNFIGLSFIADDLECSQFIDDKCFGDILTGLDKNNISIP